MSSLEYPLRRSGWLVLPLVTVFFAGCTDMYDNQRMKPLEESRYYKDRASSRPIVEGTVPRGHSRTDGFLYSGRMNGQFIDAFPFPVSESVLERGQERFNTFCSPCHGRLGDGNGMIVQRGFPRPNSFHSDTVRARPAGYYFDVITNGFGRMYSYASSVPVEDRWTIVAYIRALQLSQATPVTSLSPEERARLGKAEQ